MLSLSIFYNAIMRKHLKTIIQTLIFALIGVGLVIYRYQTMSLDDKNAMFTAFTKITWWWIIPLFIVSFLSHYVRAVRWRQLMLPIGLNVSLLNAVGGVLVGYLANVFVPRMGEVAKCTYVAKFDDADVDKLIGTIIIERIIDMLCFGLLTLITLIFQYKYIAPYFFQLIDYFKKKLYTETGQLNFLLVILVLLGVICVIYAIIYLYKKLLKTKIGKFLEGLKDGIASIKKVRSLTWFIINSLLIWVLYTISAIMVFKAMPDISHLPLLAGLSIMTFGSFAMIVPAPGSIAYPIIVAPVLLLYGVSEGVGQAYGWVNWALQNVTVICFGLIALLFLPILNKIKNDKTRIS